MVLCPVARESVSGLVSNVIRDLWYDVGIEQVGSIICPHSETEERWFAEGEKTRLL